MTRSPAQLVSRHSDVSRRGFLGAAAGTAGLFALGSPLLAACSSGGSSGGGSSSTLTFMNRWSDPTSQKAANGVFDQFKKTSGVSVKNQVQPSTGSTYQPAVRTAFSSSTAPDLATDISGPEVYNLAKAGALMDLTDFYNANIKSRAKAGATAGSTLDGKIWGLSDGASVGNCIWYNADYLSKYGVDPNSITTMSAWIAAMQHIKQGGGTPIAIGAKDQWPGGHYLNDLVQRRLGSTNAMALYNRTVLPKQPDTVKWTDDQVVSAFSDYLTFKPLFQNGFLGEAAATTDSQFLSGKVGFYEMGSWLLSTMRQTPPSFTPGVMLFPAVDGGQGTGKEVTLGNDTIIVSKNADPDAVHKFFDFFTQPATLAGWSGSMFVSPPYTFDVSAVSVSDPTLKDLFAKVNEFNANAGDGGAALFNDQAIDVNIYTKYIWQGSVGLMSGAVSPEDLAKQLEDATVQAQQKLA
jgi:raffinose/stachyose/melibiose transport system substrate-binding protein